MLLKHLRGVGVDGSGHRLVFVGTSRIRRYFVYLLYKYRVQMLTSTKARLVFVGTRRMLSLLSILALLVQKHKY